MSITDRFQLELDLLQTMYPDEIIYTSKSHELRNDHGRSTIILRLPDQYPVSGGLPDLILANDEFKNDIRQEVAMAIRSLNLVTGEEVLDAVLASFHDVAAPRQLNIASKTPCAPASEQDKSVENTTKTTIIWLHHLLATSKRKHALHPLQSNHGISGITKPGYPGIMLFSGPAAMVDEHVLSLKRLNWQAFQIRYETEDDQRKGKNACEWKFEHGPGIREVESMAEAVKAIIDEERKEEFLKAVGVK